MGPPSVVSNSKPCPNTVHAFANTKCGDPTFALFFRWVVGSAHHLDLAESFADAHGQALGNPNVREAIVA